MKKGSLLVAVALGATAFILWKAYQPKKPASQQPATSGTPFDWVKPGSQQDQMLADQARGL